jgi:hypothetical protein
LILLLILECPRPVHPPRIAQEELGLVLFDLLAAPEAGAAAVHPFQDTSGGWHIRADLSLERYAALESILDLAIKTRSARIEKKEQERREGTVNFLWDIRGSEGGASARVRLLFLCPLAGPPENQKAELRVPLAAIIIDDIGYNLDLIRTLGGFGRPLTVAVLPFAPLTRESAETARREGLEVMLHLPLESSGSPAAKVPETILTGMAPREIRERVVSCLARVPEARGLNNHTGSLATEDPEVMMSILAVVKERGLYFVDSRTSPDSVGFDAARALGVPAATRKVFLDETPGAATVKARFEELLRAARKTGRAVGIGHAKSETIKALGEYLGLADRAGVKLVFASEIVR